MYRVSFTNYALKQLKKFDKFTQRILFDWISKNLEKCQNPRINGKALTANCNGQWRYRVGDYRIIVDIKDNELIILVIAIGHHKEIYK